MMKRRLSHFIAVFSTIVGLTAVSASAQNSPGGFPNITIKNFGQMDTNYFRGGRPKQDEIASLRSVGINTIIDLQDEPTNYEKSTAEALGMKYINIPMDDGEYPPQEAIDRFLREINDPANGVMFVHCKGGKHRAGVTGAVYRFTKYGWDYDKVMKEMLNFKFDTSWGRDEMKDFVVDYAAKMRQSQSTEIAAGTDN
jgi:protein tyrosine/serine phosphatase